MVPLWCFLVCKFLVLFVRCCFSSEVLISNYRFLFLTCFFLVLSIHQGKNLVSCIICSTVCLQLEVNNNVNRDMQIKIYISSFLKELGFSRPSKQICHDISHVSSAFTHSTKLGPQSPHSQLYVG